MITNFIFLFIFLFAITVFSFNLRKIIRNINLGIDVDRSDNKKIRLKNHVFNNFYPCFLCNCLITFTEKITNNITH